MASFSAFRMPLPPPALPPRRAVAPTACITATGLSGRTYPFQMYPVGMGFISMPGVYMFAYPTREGWRAVYVGESADLDRRVHLELSQHHCWPAARYIGATHIGVMVLDMCSEQTRLDVERDLIDGLEPVLNRQ